MKPKRAPRKRSISTRREAVKLLCDPQFLYRTGKKIGELGVVGEDQNRLVCFLAGITKDAEDQVSVMVKGESGSGKSNILKTTLRLFPHESVIYRSSLSKKAPVYSEGSLRGKILYMHEYRGTADAQFLLRLQQSEGEISHEFATLRSSGAGTQVVRRVGTPVVFTTTTREKVFADDETRFLSIWMDDSREQNLAVIKAQLKDGADPGQLDLSVWHEAVRLVSLKPPAVKLPSWFEFVADQLPADHVRVRRDWQKFLALSKAIALCRRFSRGQQQVKEIPLDFHDYYDAYKILNPALASTLQGVSEREITAAQAVGRLHKHSGQPVAVKDIAGDLGWAPPLIYKVIKRAVLHRLLKYEEGTREMNLKRVLPMPGTKPGFLPTPGQVFLAAQELGLEIHCIHPLTGEEEVFRRPQLRKMRVAGVPR